MRMPALLASSLALGLTAGAAQATTLNFAVHTTGYHVNGTETGAELIAAYNAGAFQCATAVTHFAPVGPGTCGSSTANQATLMSLEFDLAQAGAWNFRMGPDWGWGGAFLLDGQVIQIVTDDRWWEYNWNAVGEILQSALNLDAGHHVLQWLGFEGCCSGQMAVQFQGGSASAWTDLSIAAFDAALPAAIPAPAGAALLGLGLLGLGRLRRKSA
ncbi:MAG: CCXG family PEP-CTERM protein [Gammaproteobacteria bacterium]|nr:CCXG family PEP-CTERM protein [Gammaproteobacteria bacterium]